MLFKMVAHLLLVLFVCPISFAESVPESKVVRVGSKRFTENYILAEIIARLLEFKGYQVERYFGLGGTMVAFTALENGDIDLYPEYSGTIEQTILKETSALETGEFNRRIQKKGYQFFSPFGFNNTYAIALRSSHPQASEIKTISDLKKVGGLRAVFSHEFVSRPDGWGPLLKLYGINHVAVKSLDHNLAYDALTEQQADLMDAFSTDAKIEKFKLFILEDNLNFFPKYYGGVLAKTTLKNEVKEILAALEGLINESTMIELNHQAEVQGIEFSVIAELFLEKHLHIARAQPSSRWSKNILVGLTLDHLYLTFVAILFASLVAIPLGMALIRLPEWIAQGVLGFAGLLQTIPSIALLAFMIPIFGIGVKPAIVGLFLYSLLPILRNTYAAISSIDPNLLLVARGIGLHRREILVFVEWPMALPLIIAGLRTATVISVGTATLAAFIGAGGLGDPIVTGLALNDPKMILSGAIPAAGLAIAIEIIFNWIEKMVRRKYGQTAN